MGIANSRELHGNRQRRSSPCFESSNQGENRYRRYFFRRRMPSTTISPTLPNVAQSNSNQFLYGTRSGMSSIPVYAPLPPLSSRLPPMSYNNFPVASYMPQQPMMVLPQRVAPMMSTPYMNPIQLMSYVPHDSESQGIELVDNDRTVRQRALHSHVNFKPTTVIDHIKTKVQGKRSTHSNSKDASIVANNNNSNINSNINNNHNNNNNNTKYTSQEYIKSATKQALPMPLTQSNSTLPKLSDRNSFASQDNTFTDRTTSISAQPETLVNGSQNIDKDENSTRTVDWRIDTMDSDVETNHTFQIRDDDFNLIFNDLPSNEQLIIAYPCAWRKDIFMHGKMFLSVNYVCFYACFLKWSESLCIAYKDIISITREKSAKVVPNAIKLRTKNQEHFVASYIPRERIFIAIFRLWQNALLEQQLNYEQLRDVVYSGQMNNEESSDESDASIEQENNNRYIVNVRRKLLSTNLILTSQIVCS
ncbi:unnamed protein product [Rotaria magnacalcarata]|uniref:GRAM domain-containing protein n=3 Tax=Rotaria magnacalcarata TaxID=392030 RepID=A0A8S2KDF8_9BILA|nr:unnamed protein product [Rotaria magnacalcarata]